MALVKCTECDKDVSDRAVTCPNCGSPMHADATVVTTTATTGDAPPPSMPARPTVVGTVSAPANNGPIPGGLQLGRDEQVAKTASFMFSLRLFFLSTTMVLTNKRLSGEVPNTILGVIPMGSRKFTFPLSNISAVNINTKVNFGSLILGVILAWVGFALFGNAFIVGLVLVLFGLVLLVGAFYTQIDIQNTGAGREKVQVAVTQKGTAQDFVSELNNVIAARL